MSDPLLSPATPELLDGWCGPVAAESQDVGSVEAAVIFGAPGQPEWVAEPGVVPGGDPSGSGLSPQTSGRWGRSSAPEDPTNADRALVAALGEVSHGVAVRAPYSAVVTHDPAAAHYALTPEPIEVIRAWGLGFSLGCVVKYIARHGRKPGASVLDDLRKARSYLDHEIAHLERSVAEVSNG